MFVLSGVFDSLDRVEATELVKKYGGKVTSSLSRNTTYLVVGVEAGETKLKKVRHLTSILVTPLSICILSCYPLRVE